MAFSREHFVAVAAVLREQKASKKIIEAFIDDFIQRSRTFDAPKFREAAKQPTLKRTAFKRPRMGKTSRSKI